MLNSIPHYLSHSLLVQKLIGSSDSCPSGRLDVMPVRVLSEGEGPGAQVPAHLTRIPISVIRTSTDYANSTVKVCLQQPVNREELMMLTVSTLYTLLSQTFTCDSCGLEDELSRSKVKITLTY